MWATFQFHIKKAIFDMIQKYSGFEIPHHKFRTPKTN